MKSLSRARQWRLTEERETDTSKLRGMLGDKLIIPSLNAARRASRRVVLTNREGFPAKFGAMSDGPQFTL
jgi:hypothetical protein